MTLASTVLLTTRIQRLADFYETLLRQAPTWYRDDYAAFETAGSTLALFTVAGHDEHIRPGAAVGGKNRSMKMEFEVDDIETTYERLRGEAETYDWVRSPPADMPWGTRIVVLRDPDGHLVELYAPRDASA
jgi:catechol 2,3-dioxygenase-like lactoylglutathione lyase family enzyme